MLDYEEGSHYCLHQLVLSKVTLSTQLEEATFIEAVARLYAVSDGRVILVAVITSEVSIGFDSESLLICPSAGAGGVPLEFSSCRSVFVLARTYQDAEHALSCEIDTSDIEEAAEAEATAAQNFNKDFETDPSDFDIDGEREENENEKEL
jgi:hypothetical protein